ncbi:MAG: spore coat protein CotJB [Clostridia bacterium]|nr:spore coat protein CotJB [Clostridia bacterium]
MCNEREALMKKLMQANFVLDDMRLYLDTHPCDEEGIKIFEAARMQRDEFLMEYEAKFGPVLADNGVTNGQWNWIEKPWPWQNEV